LNIVSLWGNLLFDTIEKYLLCVKLNRTAPDTTFWVLRLKKENSNQGDNDGKRALVLPISPIGFKRVGSLWVVTNIRVEFENKSSLHKKDHWHNIEVGFY